MVNAKIIGVVLLASLLGACQTTQNTVSLVDKAPLTIPNVDKVKLRDVDWQVLNKNTNVGQVLKKMGSNSAFAINPRSYQNLTINEAQLTRTIKQLQDQVNAYKQYYQPNVEQSKEKTDGKR